MSDYFEKIHLTTKFSPKDIPLPSINEYKKKFIAQQEKFGHNFGWRAYKLVQSLTHNNTHIKDSAPRKKTYGLKSDSKPPIVKEIEPFMNDFFAMINKLEFRKYNDPFLQDLKNDINKMKKAKKIIIPADKTRNLYACDTTTYQKILNDNITTEYKKAQKDMVKKVNAESAKFASNLELENRMQAYTTTQCMITYKDHKENAITRPTFRLINPAKTDLGRVSKDIVERVTTEVRTTTKLIQWRNTQDVLTWFKGIKKDKNISFFKFDIQAFYPSISPELLTNSIEFARSKCDICDEEFDTIMQCRKTFLFNNGEPWVKKGEKENFDVAMGSYDGAEICELVGLYLLHQMTSGKEPIFKVEDVGLYRDDCLAIIKGSARVIEKKVKVLFMKENLKIVVEPSAQTTDFLDVKLNLSTREYRPFRKPNDNPIYINAKSNHPPSIIKQLPKMIEKRISSLSSTKEIFENEIGLYEKALKNSGYNHKMTYTPEITKNNRIRSKEITWFNPPFNKAIKTNVGAEFLKLIDHHFHNNHPLHEFFNRSSIKVSYSTTSNTKNHIAKNNAKIINSVTENENNQDERKCNCTRKTKDKCPNNGNCLEKSVVYQAHVTANAKTMIYTGMTKNTFKQRFNGHNATIKKRPTKERVTTLSDHIWKLKDSNTPFSITWSIKSKAYAFSSGSKKCDLCITEKLTILSADPRYSLNQRSELLAKCPHKRAFNLKEYFESSAIT